MLSGDRTSSKAPWCPASCILKARETKEIFCSRHILGISRACSWLEGLWDVILVQAFLSGGKRFASPLSGRQPRLQAAGEDRKGPSFADLLNRKGRSYQSPSRADFRQKLRPLRPEPLRVAMVMADPPGLAIPHPGPQSPAVASSLSTSHQAAQDRAPLGNSRIGSQAKPCDDSRGPAGPASRDAGHSQVLYQGLSYSDSFLDPQYLLHSSISDILSSVSYPMPRSCARTASQTSRMH